jgi:plastocyanin
MHYFGTLRSIVLVALLALTLAACGESSKVGDESLLDFKEQVDQEGRLGDRTTTTTAPPSDNVGAAGSGGKAGIQQETTTTTAAPTTTTERPRTVIDVSINGDGSGQTQFNPSLVRVFVGTVIKWTNNDTEERSAESDDAETFYSGMIPPGGTFEYTATTPGKFNYSDGTRPYAVGRVEVLAR